MLSPDDAELVRRDPTLPGLALLLDPEALAEALPPRLEPQAPPQSTYVRYKPRTSCLVGYHLRTAAGETDVYAQAYPSQASDKLRKTCRHAGDTGHAPIVLPDRAVIVSLFPADRRVKALARLALEESRSDLLRRLFPDRAVIWNGTLDTLRYKPERRWVGRLAVAGEPVAVVKLYCAPDYREVVAGSKRLDCGEMLRVPRRLGHSNRCRAAAFEWLPGRLLSESFLRPEFSAGRMASVGVALAELHLQHNKDARRVRRRTQLADVGQLAAGLSELCPQSARRIQGLANRLSERLWDMPSPKCAIHGDFHPSQVLLQESTVGIIDLDAAARGDPATDLGNFIAHLHHDALCGRLPADRVAPFSEALCRGYGDETVLSRVAVHVAFGLLRLAPHAFRSREPSWTRRIEEILAKAEAVLDEEARTAFVLRPTATPRSESAAEVPVIDPFRVSADPEMPFLAGALDPEEAQHHLTPLLQCLPEPGRPARLRAIRVVRHKPGRRCLIEYHFEAEDSTAAAPTVTLLGKARAKGLGKSTCRLLEMLWTRGFDDHSRDGISVPQPLGVVPPWQMWFQRKVAGVAATRLLPGPDGPALARRIAEAIHKLHRSGIAPSRRHTLADELRILHQRLPLVAQREPRWSSRTEALLEACDRLAASVPQSASRPIHRDFYADHVLVDGPRLYLVDFDLFCEGDPAVDPGNFLGHLVEQGLRTLGNPDALADCGQALRDRFVELAGKHTAPAVDAYTTLTLVRHVHLSTLFPERESFTERLLELCEERLQLRSKLPCSGH